MIINIKDILRLNDNNQYVVVSKANYENKIYYYIVDNNDPKNLKFCYEDGNELVEIEDKNLITKLLPIFYEAVKDELDNLLENN